MVRRQLGAELRRLREASGRTSAFVARELGWSDSKLSRIETARIGVSDADLARLLDAYRVDAAGRQRIRDLARQSRQRGWWEAYGDVLLDQHEAYIGYEAEAVAIHGYHAMVVPGLLQTDEYARTVVEADSPHGDQGVIEQLVGVRMARQAILSRNPPPQVRMILDEAVVRRQVGGADVMYRQLRRLIAQTRRENITVQVLPFSAGAHRGLGGSFVVLELPAEIGGLLVYCEGMTGGVIRSKAEEVRGYGASFEAISEAALSPRDTVDFLEAVTSEESQPR
jgi:transcriptional regulator with XRE-family HTH domain